MIKIRKRSERVRLPILKACRHNLSEPAFHWKFFSIYGLLEEEIERDEFFRKKEKEKKDNRSV